jgi:hypothetical protein
MTQIEWAHWRDVEMAGWRWPNFPPRELACRGTGRLKIDPASLDALQALRSEMGPLILNSAYRSPEHNRAVGGAPSSQHLLGKAFDVSMINHDPAEFEAAAKRHGFRGIGHYPDANFMHVDTRATPARWHGRGGWFPPRTVTPHAPEPQPHPVREAAAQGGAVVAVGPVVEVALREIAPHLADPWGRYALLAAVGLGLAVAVWRVTRRTSAEPAP